MTIYNLQWNRPEFIPPPKPRRPRSEVGTYLRTHTHQWTEAGTHTWPSGTVDAVFTCQCGSAIATSDIIEGGQP
jgi:hypothetical protein